MSFIESSRMTIDTQNQPFLRGGLSTFASRYFAAQPDNTLSINTTSQYLRHNDVSIDAQSPSNSWSRDIQHGWGNNATWRVVDNDTKLRDCLYKYHWHISKRRGIERKNFWMILIRNPLFPSTQSRWSFQGLPTIRPIFLEKIETFNKGAHFSLCLF